MATRASIVEEGLDRVQAAFQSVEDEVLKLQKQLEHRTEEFSKRADLRFKRIQKELRKNKVVQRAEARFEDLRTRADKRRRELESRFETQIETVLGTFQIASKSQVEKLDRKLNRISRRLSALDKVIEAHDEPVTRAASGE
ncbi:MAG TPA: phasin family protein [Planctomycetota bacterium]|nr:phasin family protein [Planctomycetota bacterium]